MLSKKYMRKLGACMRKRLGARMRLLGASMTTAESLPDSRLLCPTVGSLYAETFGCMYAVLGCKFHTADSLPDSR